MSKRPLSSSISPSTPSSRLKQVNNHTMGSAPPQAAESMFNENVVPQAAEDPLFGLARMYKADKSDKKVDLGIGAYRDNNAKPWVLPVVKKVGHSLQHEEKESKLTFLFSGGRDTTPRPRSKSRVSAHRWSCRIHRCCTEAHPRPRQPRHQGRSSKCFNATVNRTTL